MTILDVTGWSKRNIWRTSDGYLSVRPGLRRLFTLAKIAGGFSVQNPWTLEVWHYIVAIGTSGRIYLHLYDDDFVLWQSLLVGRCSTDAIPRGVSHGIVEDQIVIGSPDFDTVWGYVGGPMAIAESVASDNPGTTAIPVPRGIVCAVLNRIVIADGASLFISDPVAVTGGDPRTFVAQNQNQRPGTIFGLHEGAGGQLVCVTSAGVYALDPAAFAVQIVGSNGTDWRQVNSTEAHSYDSSANVRGRIYALTKLGYILADTEGGEEVYLDDFHAARRWGPVISAPDWRTSRMYAGSTGPVIASGEINYACMTDLAGVQSWWGCNVASTFVVRGVLRDPDGADIILTDEGAYAIAGNVDGDILLSTEAATQPRSVLSGPMPTNPQANPTVRETVFSAANPGVGEVKVAVRGKIAISTSYTASATTLDPAALVIGTSSWGDADTQHQPAPLASVRAQTDTNSDEVTIEVSATIPGSKLGPVLSVDVSSSAPERSPNRGRGGA